MRGKEEVGECGLSEDECRINTRTLLECDVSLN